VISSTLTPVIWGESRSNSKNRQRACSCDCRRPTWSTPRGPRTILSAGFVEVVRQARAGAAGCLDFFRVFLGRPLLAFLFNLFSDRWESQARCSPYRGRRKSERRAGCPRAISCQKASVSRVRTSFGRYKPYFSRSLANECVEKKAAFWIQGNPHA